MDNRIQRVLGLFKSRYSLKEVISLISSRLSWSKTQDLKYYDEQAIYELLMDFILSYETELESLLNKDISEMPLYLNDENDFCKLLAKWRLSCGH
jgi:hypothetical protein